MDPRHDRNWPPQAYANNQYVPYAPSPQQQQQQANGYQHPGYAPQYTPTQPQMHQSYAQPQPQQIYPHMAVPRPSSQHYPPATQAYAHQQPPRAQPQVVIPPRNPSYVSPMQQMQPPTKYLRRRTRSKCSNPSRIRKIVLDPSSAYRMRRRITSTTNNLARPCSNNPRPSSVYPLHHRRRQTNTVVPRYNIRPRGQKRIRKWSYRRGRRPTSSRQHGRHMHLPGHCLLISPSCYYRRRTSTLLLHAVWALCSCDTNARQTFDNIISLWLLAWAAWTLF
jgi:hypothetical protein